AWYPPALLPQPDDAATFDAGTLATTIAYAHGELQLRSGPLGAAPRWFDVRVSPLRDPSGQLTGRLVVLDDITARIQAQEALRDSEERTSMIFEQAPIGMALMDVENRLLRVNRAFCAMLGYSERELHALTLDSLTHPEDT